MMSCANLIHKQGTKTIILNDRIVFFCANVDEEHVDASEIAPVDFAVGDSIALYQGQLLFLDYLTSNVFGSITFNYNLYYKLFVTVRKETKMD